MQASVILRIILALSPVPCLLGSCAGDNIHRPEPGNPTSAPMTLTAPMVTTVPDFADFSPAISDETVTITPASAGTYRIEFAPFEISIPQMGRDISIGAISLTAQGHTGPDGEQALSAGDFECQAGDYIVKGSLSGTVSPEKVELNMLYKPGAMPFQCKSIFIYEF